MIKIDEQERKAHRQLMAKLRREEKNGDYQLSQREKQRQSYGKNILTRLENLTKVR